MISLKQWLELVEYKITETSEFFWTCYGSHAQTLDSWNQINGEGGHTFTITFDRQNQTVYEVEAYDYTNNRVYKIVNPDYLTAEQEESSRKSCIDDDFKVIYLDLDDDFMEKATAIKEGQGYDTRVQMQIDFSQDELTKYMLMAHEQDITFNQFIEQALRAAIEEHK